MIYSANSENARKRRSILACLLSINLIYALPALAAPNNVTAERAATPPPAVQRSESTGLSIAERLDPAHTFVFAVALLRFEDNYLEGFSNINRCDTKLINCLRNRGVPESNIVDLKDERATVGKISRSLKTLLAKTGPGDTFLFYYGGHGWVSNGSGVLAGYRDGQDWSTDMIARQLKKAFKGKRAILTADCCSSGALGKSMKEAKAGFPWAVLTSIVMNPRKSSTGNWTFTRSLLDCFDGHRYADTDRDGLITFRETAQYASTEMSELEKQHVGCSRSDDFDPDFVLSPVRYEQEQMPERIRAKWRGRLYPAKLMERQGSLGRVHWIDIGYDHFSKDQWRPLGNLQLMPPPQVPDRESLLAQIRRKKSAGAGGENAQAIFFRGDRVGCSGSDVIRPAIVLDEKGGMYLLHFSGTNLTKDRWLKSTAVSTPKIRPIVVDTRGKVGAFQP